MRNGSTKSSSAFSWNLSAHQLRPQSPGSCFAWAPCSLFGKVPVVALVECRARVPQATITKRPFSIRRTDEAQTFKHGCFSKSFYNDSCCLFLDSENVPVHLLSNPDSESTGAKKPTDVRAPACKGKQQGQGKSTCGETASTPWGVLLEGCSLRLTLENQSQHLPACPCCGPWWYQIESGTHHLTAEGGAPGTGIISPLPVEFPCA